MTEIDFTKTQYIEASKQGEQRTEGVKVYVAQFANPTSYINVLHTDVYGAEHRLALSPSQAESLAEILTTFVKQHKESMDSPKFIDCKGVTILNTEVVLKSLASDILALYQSRVLELQVKEDLLNSKIVALDPCCVAKDGKGINRVSTYSLNTMIYNNDGSRRLLVTAQIPLEEFLVDSSHQPCTRNEAVTLWTGASHWFTVHNASVNYIPV